MLANYLDRCSELDGKHVTVFYGMTGAGKSTLLNALLNSDCLELDDETMEYKVSTCKTNASGDKLFEISSGALSATKCLGFEAVDASKERYFVDSAGVGDSNKSDEYPNQTIIHDKLAKAKSVTLVIVVNGSIMAADRGKQFLELMTSAMRLFKHNWKDQEAANASLKQFVVPLFNNFGMIETPGMLRNGGIGKTIKLVEEKLNVYRELIKRKKENPEQDAKITDAEKDVLSQLSGLEYPSDGELESIYYFLNYVKENIKAVEPGDDFEDLEDLETIAVKMPELR